MSATTPRPELVRGILSLSTAHKWDSARSEWRLFSIQMLASGDGYTCLCGHTPIRELCHLENITNNNTTIVGNCCVNQFLGLHSEAIFSGLRRIRNRIEGSLSKAAIEYLHEVGWLNDWEYGFYLNIRCKRSLSVRQHEKKLALNRRVLERVMRSSK